MNIKIQELQDKLCNSLCAELDIKEDEGKFYVDGLPDELSHNIFKLSHALTKRRPQKKASQKSG